MRRIQYFLIVLLLIFLIPNEYAEALTINTGFSTEEFSEDELNTFITNFEISMLTYEPEKRVIECFDVNEKGLIAIGCASSENKTICIYSNDGIFQYGYSFKSYGSFGIKFDENSIIIYLVRSSVAVSVNLAGEIEGALRILETYENNTYWNKSVFAKKREVSGTEYTLRNNMGIFNLFASSYSQLVALDINGEESILYDVSSTHMAKMIVMSVCILLFVSVVVYFVAREFVRLKNNAK